LTDCQRTFGGLAIDEAAGWTWDFLRGNDVVVAEATANKPTIYIGETGWPTRSMDAEVSIWLEGRRS
jgi:glucan 1,3-beta-glucosidase